MHLFRNALRWPARNPVLLTLAALASILSYLDWIKDSAKGVFHSWGVDSPLVSSAVTFLGVYLCLLLFSVVVEYIVQVRNRNRLRAFPADTQAMLWAAADSRRIEAFRQLRSEARKTMLVLGVGMTKFSSDLVYLEKLLERGIHIRLLMIKPQFVLYPVTAERFDKYFSRVGYGGDVEASFQRLVRFIEGRRRDLKRKGQVDLRTYSDLIPMNVTIIDENGKGRGKMLIEWCFPYCEWRVGAGFSRSGDELFFDNAYRSIEKIWENAERAADDER